MITTHQKSIVAAAINRIIRDPKSWNQAHIKIRRSCGTQYCFVGFIMLEQGKGVNLHSLAESARDLDLNHHEADWLFAPWRTFNQLYTWAKAYIARTDDLGSGYDECGRDWLGFSELTGLDREDYNRSGFNWPDTVDREGYRPSGMHKDQSHSREPDLRTPADYEPLEVKS